MLLAMRSFSKAAQSFQRAIELKPATADAWYGEKQPASSLRVLDYGFSTCSYSVISSIQMWLLFSLFIVHTRTGGGTQTDAPQQLWQVFPVWLLFVLCAGLGDCFRLLERHHESIHCCTEALKHKAVYPEAMLTRARSALSTGYHQQALTDYQHLLQNHVTVFQPPQIDGEQASRQQVEVQFLALV